ncbi:mucin-2-like [Pelobates fuscus]|uniref:mucin-2-like n=1 Tax=Pelobates fuscus TaxID=191477 RepID=UPI002FE4C58A
MGYQLASLLVLLLAFTTATGYEVITGRVRNHGHSVCSAWGNFHYKTFDGDVYQFPGTCTYNLASDCQNDYQEFSIHLSRHVQDGNTFINKLIVTIKDVIVQLKNNLVVVNGEIAMTPYYSFGILIHKSNGYIKLYTKMGLTLMWNQEDAVMVELDSKFNNRTCGLCGDYNGVPIYDEFVSEGISLKPIQFGILQNIHDPNDKCSDPDETQIADTSHCSKYRSVCEQHLDQSAFSDCSSLLDLESYIQACTVDLCFCDESQLTSCVCNTITEYSRQCSHAGGRPGIWRTQSFCNKECPGNMIYQESASPCMSTCSHLAVHSLCEEHYMDGCFCPEGTVQDDLTNKGCVEVTECHCKHQGVLYTPGQKIQQDCDECLCVSGRWSCTDNACSGLCAIEGGAHFTTFDGKSYIFHGDCYYILSKGIGNESDIVVGELTPCSSANGDTCLKSVVLVTDNKKNIVAFKADGSVLLNELEVSLPHVTASFSIVKPLDSYIIVQTSSLQLQIQLQPIMQLYINVEKNARGSLQGLCGDFNSKEGDDFKTSGGLVEATASAFANTWKAQPSCHDKTELIEDPCSISIENKMYAEYWCSFLEKEESVFAKCHSTIDVSKYAKRCRYDACSCKNSEVCMCAAVSSYVRACAAKGIILWGWKNGICDKDIATCPTSQVYLYNLTTCQPTCRSLAEGEKVCSSMFTPVDGCGCPAGEYLNEDGECVPISKCSCFYHGMYYQAQELIHIQNDLCTCRNGIMHCTTHVAEDCPDGKVFFDCNKVPTEGLKTPAYRSCQTLSVEYFKTECISGCVCPNGLLDDGAGGCVHEDSCPCVHNEDIFPHGTKVNVDCNTCLCQKGRWTCTDSPCYGTCTIYGNGHYVTFDGKFYDFDGNCEFVAAQDYCGIHGSHGNFSVITENIPCGTTGTTCSKAIKIFIGSTELKLADKHLEETLGDISKRVHYRTREVGLYLVIEANNGILLIWDRKTTIFIKVSPLFKGKVCGLCGNFDDNSKNDFTTSHMLQVNNVLEFGNSWKAKPTCPDVTEEVHPCSLNPHRHSWAEKQCGLIKSDVFKVCHSKVDPTLFYEACVNDACSCDSGGDCECFCTAVAAYAQECTKAGACVYWRTPDICPIFCDYYNPEDECEWHYHPCGSDNIKTCRSINGIDTNVTINYLEGCYPTCPPDKPIFDESKKICVKEEECGCFIDGKQYEPGSIVPSDVKCHTCVCTAKSEVDCKYDQSACFCIVNGTRYEENDIIYSGVESGICFVVRCVNGTEKVEMEPCSTTTVVTTTSAVTSTQTVSTTTVIPPSTTLGSTTCILEFVCKWTEWYDVSTPQKDPEGGEYETYDEIRKHHSFCNAPHDIQCRAVGAPDVNLDSIGQTVHCDVSYGLVCRNNEQKQQDSLWQICYDYEVRMNCCEWICATPTTIPPSSTTTTKTTTSPATSTPSPPSTTSSPSTTTTTDTTTSSTPSTTSPPSTPTTTETTTSSTPSTTSPTSTSTPTTTETTTSSNPSTTSPTSTSTSTTESTTTPTISTETSTSEVTSPTTSSVTFTTTITPATTTCTTEETPETTPTFSPSVSPTPTCVPVKECKWSDWFDVSYPKYEENGGDFETYENIRKEGHEICDKPDNISCRAERYKDVPLDQLGQIVTCDVSSGLVCYNKDQTSGFLPVCYNYQISVYCCEEHYDQEDCISTTASTTTSSTPQTTTPASTTVTTTTPSSSTSTTELTTSPTRPTESTTSSVTTSPTISSTSITTSSTTQTTIPPTSETTTTISTSQTTTPTTTTTSTPETNTLTITTISTPQTTTPASTTVTTTTPSSTTSTTELTTSPTSPTESTTTSVTTSPTISSTCVPVKECKWSDWFDVSYPKYEENGGDFETYENIRKEGHEICDKPENISCRAERYKDVPLDQLGQIVTCDVSSGLVCYNKDQTSGFLPVCYNYQISVYCCEEHYDQEDCISTTASTTTSSTPQTTTTTTITSTPQTTTPASTTVTTTTPSSSTSTTELTTSPTRPTESTTSSVTTSPTISSTSITTSSTTQTTIPPTSETTTTISTSQTTTTTSTPETNTPTISTISTPQTTTPASTTVTTTTPSSTTSSTELTTRPTSPTESTTTSVTTSPTISTTCVPVKECKWSDWFDVSYPKYEENGGDFETYENIRKEGHEICDKPENISCRAERYKDVPLDQLGQIVTCDVSSGLVCYNKDQTSGFLPVCYNYQISVYCCEEHYDQEDCISTTASTTTSSTPQTTTTTTITSTPQTTTPASTTVTTTTPSSSTSTTELTTSPTRPTESTTSSVTTSPTISSTSITTSSTTQTTIPPTSETTTTISTSQTTTTTSTPETNTPTISTISTPQTTTPASTTVTTTTPSSTTSSTELTTRPTSPTESTTTSVTTSPTISTTCVPVKECKWSDWFDVSYPKYEENGGDFETYENIRKEGHEICDKPENISCRAERYKDVPLDQLGQIVTCDVSSGLVCYNKDQTSGFLPVCYNYQISVYCCEEHYDQEDCISTTASTTTSSTPQTTTPASTTVTTTTPPSTTSTTELTTSPTIPTESTTSSVTTSPTISRTSITTSSTTQTAIPPTSATTTTISTSQTTTPTTTTTSTPETNTPTITTISTPQTTTPASTTATTTTPSSSTSTTELTTSPTRPTESTTSSVTTSPTISSTSISTSSTTQTTISPTSATTTTISTSQTTTPKTTTTSTPETNTPTITTISTPQTTTPASTTVTTTTTSSTTSTTELTTSPTSPTESTTTSVTTSPTISSTCVPVKECKWSDWFDVSYPKYEENGGDFETYENIRKEGHEICDKPENISCRAERYKDVPLDQLGQIVTCDVSSGLVCYNKDQTSGFLPVCYNYQISVYCCEEHYDQEDCISTTASTTTSSTPQTTTTTTITSTPQTTTPASTTVTTTTPSSSTSTTELTTSPTRPTESTTSSVTTSPTISSTSITTSSTTQTTIPPTSETTTTISTSQTTTTTSTPETNTPTISTISTPQTTTPASTTVTTTTPSSTTSSTELTTRPTSPTESTTTSVTTSPTISTTCVPVKECKWSDWFDVSYPKYEENGGDFETYENIRKEGHEICDKPENISCRAERYKDVPLDQLGQIVTCDVSSGLVCYNKDQTSGFLPVCYNYQISVYCCEEHYDQEDCISTTASTTTSSSPQTTTPASTTVTTTTPPSTTSTTELTTSPTIPTESTTSSVTTSPTISRTSITTSSTTQTAIPPTSETTTTISTSQTTTPTTTTTSTPETNTPTITTISTPQTTTPASTTATTTTPSSSTSTTELTTSPTRPTESTTSSVTTSPTISSTSISTSSTTQTTISPTSATTTTISTSQITTPKTTTTSTPETNTPTITTISTPQTTTPASTTVTTTTTSSTTSTTELTTSPTSPTESTTTSVTTSPTISTTCVPVKECKWSDWFDVSYPKYEENGGDFETYENIRKEGHEICDKPDNISCRAERYKDVPLDQLGQIVTCDVSSGLVCYNKDQTSGFLPVCYNYQISVYCCEEHYDQEDCISTTASTTTSSTPQTTTPASTTVTTTTPPSTTSTTELTTSPTIPTESTTSSVITSPTISRTSITTSSTTQTAIPPTSETTTTISTSQTTTPTTTTTSTPETNTPTITTISTPQTTTPASTTATTTTPSSSTSTTELTTSPTRPTESTTSSVTTSPTISSTSISTSSTTQTTISPTSETTTTISTSQTTTPKTTTTSTPETNTPTITTISTPQTTTPASTTVTTTTPFSTTSTTELTTSPTSPTESTTTSVTTSPTISTTCVPVKECKWSDWFDVSYPKYEENGGDFETYENIRKEGHEICDKPENISCRAERYKDVPLDQLGQIVTCDVSSGLVCYNKDQTSGFLPVCYNYQISVYCCEEHYDQEDCISTTASTTTSSTPQTTTPASTTVTTTTPPSTTSTTELTTSPTIPTESTTSSLTTSPTISRTSITTSSTTQTTIPSTSETTTTISTPHTTTPTTSTTSTAQTTTPTITTISTPQTTTSASTTVTTTTSISTTSTTEVSSSPTRPTESTTSSVTTTPTISTITSPTTSSVTFTTTITPATTTCTTEETPDTTPTFTPSVSPTPTCIPVIECKWSEWFDVSYPKYEENGGDFETYENIRKEGHEICDKPENISCRAERYKDVPLDQLGQIVTCDVSSGLVCYNKDQTSGFLPVCYNYQISVYCCEEHYNQEGCITTTTSTTTSSTTQTTTTTSTPQTTTPTTTTSSTPQTTTTASTPQTATPIITTISTPQTTTPASTTITTTTYLSTTSTTEVSTSPTRPTESTTSSVTTSTTFETPKTRPPTTTTPTTITGIPVEFIVQGSSLQLRRVFHDHSPNEFNSGYPEQKYYIKLRQVVIYFSISHILDTTTPNTTSETTPSTTQVSSPTTSKTTTKTPATTTPTTTSATTTIYTTTETSTSETTTSTSSPTTTSETTTTYTPSTTRISSPTISKTTTETPATTTPTTSATTTIYTTTETSTPKSTTNTITPTTTSETTTTYTPSAPPGISSTTSKTTTETPTTTTPTTTSATTTIYTTTETSTSETTTSTSSPTTTSETTTTYTPSTTRISSPTISKTTTETPATTTPTTTSATTTIYTTTETLTPKSTTSTITPTTTSETTTTYTPSSPPGISSTTSKTTTETPTTTTPTTTSATTTIYTTTETPTPESTTSTITPTTTSETTTTHTPSAPPGVSSSTSKTTTETPTTITPTTTSATTTIYTTIETPTPESTTSTITPTTTSETTTTYTPSVPPGISSTTSKTTTETPTTTTPTTTSATTTIYTTTETPTTESTTSTITPTTTSETTTTYTPSAPPGISSTTSKTTTETPTTTTPTTTSATTTIYTTTETPTPESTTSTITPTTISETTTHTPSAPPSISSTTSKTTTETPTTTTTPTTTSATTTIYTTIETPTPESTTSTITPTTTSETTTTYTPSAPPGISSTTSKTTTETPTTTTPTTTSVTTTIYTTTETPTPESTTSTITPTTISETTTTHTPSAPPSISSTTSKTTTETPTTTTTPTTTSATTTIYTTIETPTPESTTSTITPTTTSETTTTYTPSAPPGISSTTSKTTTETPTTTTPTTTSATTTIYTTTETPTPESTTSTITPTTISETTTTHTPSAPPSISSTTSKTTTETPTTTTTPTTTSATTTIYTPIETPTPESTTSTITPTTTSETTTTYTPSPPPGISSTTSKTTTETPTTTTVTTTPVMTTIYTTTETSTPESTTSILTPSTTPETTTTTPATTSLTTKTSSPTEASTISTTEATTVETTTVNTPSEPPVYTTTPETTTVTLTTTSSESTISQTTIYSSTICSCVHEGKPYPPGEITSGVFNRTYCYLITCTEDCVIKITHWICAAPTTPETSTATKKTQSTTTATTTSTTKTLATTKLPGCPFDPFREHNETWMLCNCTMARCLENNTVEIIELKCEPPPMIKCASGKPPIAVPDDDLCCWHWECECVCSGWGDPHYVTFDGTYYSYQGNCTYVLVEEIIETVDNFGVYIDNYDCGARDRVSCPRNIIVRHETQTIQIRAIDLDTFTLQVVVNGDIVGTPYKKYGVKVYRSGINYVVEIPELKANITYNGLAFSVKLPYKRFGNNTQGQCGTCTNNRTDDCMLPSGKIISNCEIMADAWVVPDPRKPQCSGTLQPTGPPKVTVPSTSCKPSPLCELIKAPLFQQCHKSLPPENFYQACNFDSCHVPNSNIECTSLQQYALMCADQGICVDWRSHTTECKLTCPSHKVYNACGPALPKTCQTTPEEEDQIKDKQIVEGCFCPHGTMPFSSAVDVCVQNCGCVGPDNIPREFGEIFQFDCKDCVCREGGNGITCSEHQCQEKTDVLCELDGFYPEIVTSSTDSCCQETVCKCNPSLCTKTPQNCKLGYEIVGEIPDGQCCPIYRCVRKNVCVHGHAEYLPGSPVYSDNCQICVCPANASVETGLQIQCTRVACNVICPEGFELRMDAGDCCGACVQTHCAVENNDKYILLKPGETVNAENDNCTLYSCTVIRDQYITSVSQISCPFFDEARCEPGTVQFLPNGCCKICIEKSSSCKLENFYDYMNVNNCRSSQMVKMARCEGSCSTFSMYSAAAKSISHKCTCCQEVKTSVKNVMLQCSDGSIANHQYIDVDQCECINTDCGSSDNASDSNSHEDEIPTRQRRSLRKRRHPHQRGI